MSLPPAKKRKLENEMEAKSELQAECLQSTEDMQPPLPKTEGTTSPQRTLNSSTHTECQQPPTLENSKDTAEGTSNDGTLTLRKYQLELTRLPLQGKNTIICAPRGCGKTVMTGHVIHQLFLQKNNSERPFKALFIVHIRKLIEQKSAVLGTFLNRQGMKVGVIDEGRNINVILESKTVVVLTAMIVKNAIKNGIVKLTDIDLLVFDECHHTNGSHPYNELMRTYLEAKLDNHTPGLPQILGLTACIGTGRSRNTYDHLLTSCGNLDCYHITQVRQNMEELEMLHPKPSEVKIVAVPGRPENDPLRVQFLNFMKEIEKKTGEMSKVTPGTHPYETWAIARRKTAKMKKQREKIIAFNALVVLNSALSCYEELSGQDALTILKAHFTEPPKLKLESRVCHSFDEIAEFFTLISKQMNDSNLEKKWFEYFTSLEPELKGITGNTEDNRLLAEVKSLLQNMHKEKTDSKGLILTRTRFLTERLVLYIKDCTELTEIVRPARLTGQEGDQYSMTEVEQKEVLQQFKNGTINLLVTTDIAEEGIDLGYCDYVIRYNVTTSEIGSLQSRARASQCYLIVREGSDVEKRELENMKTIREIEETLERVQNEDPTNLAADVEKKQKENWVSYKSKKKQQGAAPAASANQINPSRVQIVCLHCNNVLSTAKHIIKKGTFYICVDEELPDRVTLNRWDETDKRWKVHPTDYHAGEILCGGDCCNRKLGQIVQFRQGQRREGFVLCRQYIMFDLRDKQLQACKGWSMVPFSVKEEAIDE